MRILLHCEADINEDGYDQSVTLARDGVETVEDMLSLMSDFMRAAGFSYIETLEAFTEDGDSFRDKF